MKSEFIREDLVHGLGAAKAGMEVAARATSEIQEDVSNTRLQDQLKQGEQQSKIWAERVQRAISEIGEAKKPENEVLEAVYTVSKKVRAHSTNEMTRDLGIIASGQMALHYWIASFGTLRTYAEQAEFDQAAKELQMCLDEAKQSDLAMSEIAAEIMGASNQMQPQQNQHAQSQSQSIHH